MSTPAVIALLTSSVLFAAGLLVLVASLAWRARRRQERLSVDLQAAAYAQGYDAGRVLQWREKSIQRPLASDRLLLANANGDQEDDVVRLVRLLERVEELATELRLCAEELDKAAKAGLAELSAPTPPV